MRKFCVEIMLFECVSLHKHIQNIRTGFNHSFRDTVITERDKYPVQLIHLGISGTQLVFSYRFLNLSYRIQEISSKEYMNMIDLANNFLPYDTIIWL